MENLLKKIRKKRLIFTVTTGRSGTKYLAHQLSLLRNITVDHEAKPAFHDHLREVLRDENAAIDFWLKQKFPHILELDTKYYSDTSHVACKGFLEALLKLDVIPDLILLKRNNSDVAKSLYQLGTIPGRSDSGIKFLLSPRDSSFLPIQNWKELTDYQLCYWYTLEIEKRQHRYKELFHSRGSKIFQLKFDDLISGRHLYELRKFLDLPRFTLRGYIKYMRRSDSVINDKSKQKNNELNEINMKLQEQELHKILDKCV